MSGRLTADDSVGRQSHPHYVRDHPQPLFHAIYGEHEAVVAIETVEIIDGALPKAAARLVKEWALARQDQLRQIWSLARAGERPEKTAGLDAD